MNSTLSAGLIQADGRYLSNEELQPFASYIQTYTTRLMAYSVLRDQADTLVLQALQKLAVTDGPTVQQHTQICQRDMSYVVRMLAMFVLRDDEHA
ncbi:MAG: hypothetical protein Fur0046_33700 [Cyanobacteria bacterium J069]